MRRYLLAATLSFTSLAVLSSAPQAVPSQGRVRVAQATQASPAGGDAQPKPDEKKDEHKGGRDGGGQKGGGARGKPPAREAQPRSAPQNAPKNKPQASPNENRERRREPARDAGPPRKEAPRAVQVPPSPPPAAQPPQGPKREERRGRDRDPGQQQPQQARPQPPPAPPPPPAQQAQPPAAPAPAAQGRGEDRGKRGDRGDKDRGAAGPAPGQPPQQAQPPTAAPGAAKAKGPASIDEIKRGRRQRVENGGKRTVTEEPGNRTIIQEKGAPAMIRHDEGERLSRTSKDVRREKRPDGGNLTIAVRPGGIEVFSEFDSGGRLMRRYRRDRDGRESNLIDNRRFRGAPIILKLGPPRLNIARERYIMDYDRASDDDLYDALMDGPVDRLERGYSLDEIRYNGYLRDRMRRIDLDTVNFEFGAWEVPHDQYSRLERIARIINRILDRQPDEVFLIEGHTDAVGSELDNLTLSDRRAEEVAIILTETFNVPPENLITQGYGEEFLKVPTLTAERANRRVAVRRITPLLARDR